MARVMPNGYEPPVRGTGGSAGELAHAAQLARQNPGAWIEVHDPRPIKKPTAWCSEVNLGQKDFLENQSQPGERWEASYETTTGDDGKPWHAKLLRLVPAPAVADATAVQPTPAVPAPVPEAYPAALPTVQGGEH